MEKIIGLQIIVLMIANVHGNPCLKSRSECQEIRMPLVSNELKAPLVAELDISAMNKQLKSYIKDDIQLTFSKDIKDMVKSEQNNLKTTMLEDYTSKMKTTKEEYDNNISSIITNLQAKEGKVQEKMSEVLKNLNASEANFNEKMTDLLGGFEHKQESLKLAMLSEYLSKLQVSHDTNNQQIIDLANDLKSQFANLSRNIKDESVEVKSYLQTQTKELDEWKAKLMETIKGIHAPLKFKDCSYMTGKQLKSGVYTIYPNNVNGIKAYCDMTTEGGGWTVIQRRIDGTTNFDRTWNEYKEGFGDVEKEYWLGNKYLNILTSSGKYELRVDLVDSNNKKTYAVYKKFAVGDEQSKYELTIGDYTGTAGDRMYYNNGRSFTTKDRDNDARSDGNCATDSSYGPWWNGNCSYVSLNLDLKEKVMRWKDHKYIKAVMKIRKIN